MDPALDSNMDPAEDPECIRSRFMIFSEILQGVVCWVGLPICFYEFMYYICTKIGQNFLDNEYV